MATNDKQTHDALPFLLQIIEPNQVDSETGNVIQTMENVSNFIAALHGLQFPATCIFSIGDVESTGWEER